MAEPERQLYLKHRYNFICQCEACKKKYQIFSLLPRKHPEYLMFLFSECGGLIPHKSGAEVFDYSKRNFRAICEYINKNDKKNYPSFEILHAIDIVLRCCKAFLDDEEI